MRVIRIPSDTPPQPFIEFAVAKTRDGKVCGQVIFSQWTSDRTVEFSKPGFGVAAAPAWERALAEAERIGADAIVVRDPENLFPGAA